MSIIMELFIGAVGAYVVYRQEQLEKNLADISKEIQHIKWLLPKRGNPPPP